MTNAAPRVYRTEAIVLHTRDFGEADRLVTLLTPQRGQIRAIAKGVRRTRSRMAGHVDLFTRSSLLLAHGRQLDIVTQAETLENFTAMRRDLWRTSYAHYVAELVEGFTVEDMPGAPVYNLMVRTLRRLANDQELDMAVRSFELELMALSGYRPQLHRCLQCDVAIEPGANGFSPKLGGVLCPICIAVDSAAVPISVPALKLMRNLQTNETAVLRLPNIGEEIRREVEKRVQEYVAYRLEAKPRSIDFLNRLRTEGVLPA